MQQSIAKNDDVFWLMSNSVHLKVGIHLICANNACCDFNAWNRCYCCSCLRLLHLHSCLFHWSNFGQWVDFGICGCGEWLYLIQLLTVDLRFIEIPGNCINNVLFQSVSSNKTFLTLVSLLAKVVKAGELFTKEVCGQLLSKREIMIADNKGMSTVTRWDTFATDAAITVN